MSKVREKPARTLKQLLGAMVLAVGDEQVSEIVHDGKQYAGDEVQASEMRCPRCGGGVGVMCDGGVWTCAAANCLRLNYESSLPSLSSMLADWAGNRVRGIPAAYWGASLSSIDSEGLKVFASGWCSKPKGNVLIAGESGIGKTWAAVAMLKECVADHIRMDNVTDLYLAWKETFRLGEGEGSLLYKLVDADVLLLDDLGTNTPTDGFLSFLYTVFNSRMNAGKATIVTTNMTAASMVEKLGDAIATRVCSGAVHAMKGKNRRKSQIVI